VLKHDYEKLINSLLQEVDYELPDIKQQPKLKEKVERRLCDLDVPDELILRLQGVIGTAVCITHAAYSFLPPHIQQIVALYAAITIGIDDLASEIQGPLRCYTTELVMGEKHGHILLEALTAWLKQHRMDFGNFSGDMIVKATLDFISACYYEEDAPSLGDAMNAPGFAEYFRYKSGDSEGFAFLLFPEQIFPEHKLLRQYLPAIPYIVEYMNFVNDILSFYKEEQKVGERQNFVHTYAKSANVTILCALEVILERSSKAFQTIQAILDCDEILKKAAVKFLHGYLAFHLGQRRYRLMELEIPAAGAARDVLEGFLVA
jgi:hypothetical protein